jgi:ABC-type polysaccharide/polyol phosphate export permease
MKAGLSGSNWNNNRIERIWILAKTEFIQRYYGSFFGVFWAFLNPLFQLLIYYYIFTWFFDSQIENYAFYLLSGLLVWMFFSETTKKGLMLLKTKRYLYEHISIRKHDIYYSSIISMLISLGINFLIYFAASLFFGISYSWPVLMLPILILSMCVFVFALSLILSILNVFLEDIHHAWDIALLGIFWSIPLFYPQEMVLEQYRFLLYGNPLTGIVINMRQILLDGAWPNWNIFLYDNAVIFVILVISLILFNKLHHKSAEKL